MIAQSVLRLRPESAPVLQGPGPVADEHREATQHLLGLMAAQQEMLVIQVSGLSGGEGVSTVAASIARSLQHGSGRKIAHFRISDAGEPETDEGAGRVLTHTTVRKLLAQGVRKGLEALVPGCDLVVIESSPLLVSVESVALGTQANGVILVAESNRTTYAELREAQQAMDRSGGHLLGVILNKREYRVPRPIARLLGLPASHQRRRSMLMVLLGLAALVGVLFWVVLSIRTDPTEPTIPIPTAPIQTAPETQPGPAEGASSDE